MPAPTSNVCRLCAHRGVLPLLDCGMQPFSNRPPGLLATREDRFRLALAVCPACGLTQLDNPPPPAALRRRLVLPEDRESEPHLDDLVARAAARAAITSGEFAMGIGRRDTGFIDRLEHAYRARSLLLDPVAHLDLRESGAGLESIQAQLTRDCALLITRETGRARLLVCRGLLEYAQDLHALAAALQDLVEDGGWVVFEVRDASPAFAARDYASLNEQRACLFTPATFTTAIERLGFAVVESAAYTVDGEHLLAAIAERIAAPIGHTSRKDIEEAIRAAHDYAAAFAPSRDAWRNSIAAWRAHYGPIALFGAGPRSAVFVNLFGIADLFDAVLDDSPLYKGLCLPGTKLPILPWSDAAGRGIRAGFSGLGPWSDPAALAAHDRFVAAGGASAPFVRVTV